MSSYICQTRCIVHLSSFPPPRTSGMSSPPCGKRDMLRGLREQTGKREETLITRCYSAKMRLEARLPYLRRNSRQLPNPRNSLGVLVKVVPSRSSRVLMTVMSHHKRHHLGLWLAIIRARRYGNSSANATLLALCASGRTGRVAIADREKRSLERRRLSQLALVRDAIRTRPTCRRPLIPVTRSPKPYVHSTMLRVQQPPHSTKMMRMLIFRGIDISQPGTLSRLLIPR